MSHDTTPSPDDIQFALQEVRTVLLQQILATETGLLSVAELCYRNRGEDDITEENVRYHLREMAARDIVAKRKVPNGQRVRDLPTTFFRVTDYGEAILEQANLLAESELWAEMYEQMERTERIERIEQLKRQTRTQGTGTDPDDEDWTEVPSGPGLEDVARAVGDPSSLDMGAPACSTTFPLYLESAGPDTSTGREKESAMVESQEDELLVAAGDDDGSETDESR
jgi:hypothetical protein